MDNQENSTALALGASEAVAEEQLEPKLKTIVKKSRDAVNADNFDYAINLLQAVLKQEPRFLDGRKLLRASAARKKAMENKRFTLSGSGVSAMKIQPMIKKDPAAAIVALEKEVLAGEPYNPQGNQMLFDASVRCDLPMTAGFALETLVTGNPDNTKYMHKLGDYYFKQEFFSEAGEVFDKVAQKDPTDLLASKKSKDASAKASMVKQDFKGSMMNNLKDAGQAADLEKASRAGMTPEQINQQIEIAMAEYAADQNNLQVVRHLGALYEQKEDFDEALTYYQWAHQLAPGDTALEKQLIEVRETQRNRKIREFKGWLEANEGHPDYEKVNADYEEFSTEHKASLITDYKEQVERNPTDNALRFKYGEALFNAKELKEAIPQLQRAQQSPSIRIRAMLLLGRCYEGRNMNDLAVDQLQKAADELQIMDDTKKEILYSLGLVHGKMGDAEKSLESFKQIYSADYSYRDVADKVESSYE
ncbi:MAG: tetratricopeptide (TPR) repeat protein [Verrucomicrobiales bacterium]|jgi:tetratricopeptide (TPR) repeat protein